MPNINKETGGTAFHRKSFYAEENWAKPERASIDAYRLLELCDKDFIPSAATNLTIISRYFLSLCSSQEEAEKALAVSRIIRICDRINKISPDIIESCATPELKLAWKNSHLKLEEKKSLGSLPSQEVTKTELPKLAEPKVLV